MSFLTAEWRKLVLVNYAVDEELLRPFVPHRTVIDRWNGIAYVSLVGFMFLNTRVLGIKIPFHVNFEEVNLRFYVRHKSGSEWKRGVVFIKEIVPKPALTLVANTLYREHYQTLPMQHEWKVLADRRLIAYQWTCRSQEQLIQVESEMAPQPIIEGTEEAFITEHYWGYTRVNERTTYEYQVTHPTWEHYPILSYDVDVDFGMVYGPAFQGLNAIAPKSVMLAEGSEITVENKRKL